jgi:hypothetical protein
MLVTTEWHRIQLLRPQKTFRSTYYSWKGRTYTDEILEHKTISTPLKNAKPVFGLFNLNKASPIHFYCVLGQNETTRESKWLWEAHHLAKILRNLTKVNHTWNTANRNLIVINFFPCSIFLLKKGCCTYWVSMRFSIATKRDFLRHFWPNSVACHKLRMGCFYVPWTRSLSWPLKIQGTQNSEDLEDFQNCAIMWKC